MPQKHKKNKISDHSKDYLKYSGLAIQLVVTIFLFVILGQWLDGKFNLETPWFTLVLSLIAVMGSMYRLIKGLSN